MLSIKTVDTSKGSATAPTVVLLHGFGAPGDDLVPLGSHLGAPGRFVFPAAPLAIEWGGRAWWMIDLSLFEPGARRTDRRAEIPDGLAEARAAVLEVIAAQPADRPLVLGGFSQGAMLALDVALHVERKLAGLVLWSPTFIAEPVWTPRFARLADLPIALSHGRQDPLLPFAMTEALRDQLVSSGARVDWRPFDGGHEIPPPALAAARTIVSSV